MSEERVEAVARACKPSRIVTASDGMPSIVFLEGREIAENALQALADAGYVVIAKEEREAELKAARYEVWMEKEAELDEYRAANTTFKHVERERDALRAEVEAAKDEREAADALADDAHRTLVRAVTGHQTLDDLRPLGEALDAYRKAREQS